MTNIILIEMKFYQHQLGLDSRHARMEKETSAGGQSEGELQVLASQHPEGM